MIWVVGDLQKTSRWNAHWGWLSQRLGNEGWGSERWGWVVELSLEEIDCHILEAIQVPTHCFFGGGFTHMEGSSIGATFYIEFCTLRWWWWMLMLMSIIIKSAHAFEVELLVEESHCGCNNRWHYKSIWSRGHGHGCHHCLHVILFCNYHFWVSVSKVVLVQSKVLPM